MTKIEGTIERVRYYNEDNNYTIASFFIFPKSIEELPIDKDILSNHVTIIGNFDRKPIEDEEFILEGEFFDDKKYGLEFKIQSFSRKQIDSTIGLINFLSSELFPGIGPKKAKEIVDKLGNNAIELIKNDPKVLDDIKLSEEVKKHLVETIKKDFDNEKVRLFLMNLGLSLNIVTKIIQVFEGQDIIEIVKENPYILMNSIDRFGFKKADAVAEKLGFSKDNSYRIRALIGYILNEILYQTGNSYVYKRELYNSLCNFINEEINPNLYLEHLNSLVDEKKIFIEVDNDINDDRIYDYYSYQDEVDLAVEVAGFIKNNRLKGGIKEYKKEDILKAFNKVVEESHINFNPEQEEAIKGAFSSPITIITGGPGTGKTTIISAIIKIYMLLNSSSPSLSTHIALLAPTGRAAKRLNESTNLPASTIHRFLGFGGDGYFEYSKANKTTSRLIIVDEASMIDTALASRLLTSSSNHARVILVGDVNQLPSVGPGEVLKDLIETNLIKTTFLHKIHRQDAGSSIITLAHAVNDGYLPPDLMEKKNDRTFIKASNDKLPELICKLYEKVVDRGYELSDVQILIPMYKGTCGINIINKLIQERINPPSSDKAEYVNGGKILRVGDKVIQLVNRADKGVMNGDMGFISSINYKGGKLDSLKVIFDVLIVEYAPDELDDLTLAYAVSIHKAQGSEFSIVIMPLTTAYYVMLSRKIIYTGLTRAKKSLVLLGSPEAMALGIRIIKDDRRTILKEKLLNIFSNNSSSAKSIKAAIAKMDDKKDDDFDINNLGEGELEI